MSRRKSPYAVIPTADPRGPRATKKPRRRCRIPLRRLLACLVAAPAVVLLAVLCQGIPSTYNDVRTFERRLPQHAHHHPATRYLRFPTHLWGHGLNNVLQEALVMSYLAYAANVSYVFEDYTWSHVPLPWTIYDFALRPTRIPINAIISGPTAGGPLPDASPPLAVSAEFYNHVCAHTDATTHVLAPADVPTDADGADLVRWWQSQLARVDAPCIEIHTTDLFDRFLFGGPRVLSLFDALVASPILADFTWSPLVHAAVARNFALLQPRAAKDLVDRTTPLHDLLALHLRRGDYVRHCPNLAKWGAEYMGVNQHPSLPDRFDPRPFANDTAARREAYYLEHCLPTTTQLVARLREIRAERPGLRRVYVLSNEWAWSLGDIRDALLRDGWKDVASTVDLQLDAEQHHVSMAVDMAIAERAEVFVGNGFSSLSSNVVMLRLAKGLDPSTNRFL